MHLLGLRNSILFLIGAGLAQACSSDDSATKPTTTAGAGGGSTTGGTTVTGVTGVTVGTTGTTTAGVTTGAGGAGAGGTTGTGGSTGTDTPSPLPFVVDSLFIASGYMGDGAVVGSIMQDDNMTCLATRPPGATGHCHKFTYTPVATATGGLG